ncbi:hypothetical protein WR25_00737 [Diploscapter pachys]|uniref:Uncharacterized protein n=1 Tax=Diploscapter pachys TaxID=2018661 RepID=A0A2A2LEK8_9BILA|nr:hypothetical protein WR25_00737 [Diploscapter pachys]
MPNEEKKQRVHPPTNEIRGEFAHTLSKLNALNIRRFTAFRGAEMDIRRKISVPLPPPPSSHRKVQKWASVKEMESVHLGSSAPGHINSMPSSSNS